MDDHNPTVNGWVAALVLAAIGAAREFWRLVTKDRDANLQAMSQRIRDIEQQHGDCTHKYAVLSRQFGTIDAKLAACEEKHADAESRIERLEQQLNGGR